jgi:hypothetical protein
MKRKQLIGFFLTLGIVVSLVVGMVACGSKTTTPTTPKLSAIAVTPGSPVGLTLGSTLQFAAFGTYSDKSTADISSQVTWASGNTGVATINSTGLATGVAVGTSNITATLSGLTSGSVSLPIISLASIAVTPTSPGVLAVGAAQMFNAVGTFTDGSSRDISGSVTWVSDNAGIATASPGFNGLAFFGAANGVANGTAHITATMSGISSNSVSLTIKTLSSIAVSPAVPSILVVGNIQHFTATGTFTDGSTADITPQVTWVSDNTGVAEIDPTGVGGLQAGTANITATFSKITSSAVTLTVAAH